MTKVTDEAVLSSLQLFHGKPSFALKDFCVGDVVYMRHVLEQYEASRAAPAPQGEPVAWLRVAPDGERRVAALVPTLAEWQRHDEWRLVPLYASAPSVPDPVETERERELTKALGLALDILGELEPGDSRAVSDAFVAMASVHAGIGDAQCIEIIEAAARARKP